jgi:hypothetical protein
MSSRRIFLGVFSNEINDKRIRRSEVVSAIEEFKVEMKLRGSKRNIRQSVDNVI